MILTTEQMMSIPPPERVLTGVKCLDDALGGGYVPGTVVLITGVPGTGKSSMMLRAIPSGTIYNNNEESAASFAYKHRSIGIEAQDATWIFDKSLRDTLQQALIHRPPVLVVDSIQETNVVSTADVAEALHRFAESTGVTVFAVGHVNAKGRHFGEERVRHWIDVHLHLVDRDEIVVLKNRFPALQIESQVEEPEEAMAEFPPPSQPALTKAPRFRTLKNILIAGEWVLTIMLFIIAFPFVLTSLLGGHRR